MNFPFRIPWNGKKSQEPASFWSWFTANQERLRRLTTREDAKLVDELGRRLSSFHEGLTFETGPADDGRLEFAVSADGIKSRFAAVRDLVAAAPQIPGWEIVAFRQRKPESWLHFEMDGNTLSLADIWFTADEQAFKLDLVLYVRGFGPQTAQAIQHGSFLLVDGALGEYDVEMMVGHIEWQPYTVGGVISGLKPLRDLASLVDIMKTRIN